MLSERWQRVSLIFDDAVELPKSARAEFLNQACANDLELRAEVESLLASDEQASQFIEEPLLAIPRELFPDSSLEVAGQPIGSYRIIREVGRGGLGTVYLAERADDSYRKKVAIKLVRSGEAAGTGPGTGSQATPASASPAATAAAAATSSATWPAK
jgi:hypothetical protein